MMGHPAGVDVVAASGDGHSTLTLWELHPVVMNLRPRPAGHPGHASTRRSSTFFFVCVQKIFSLGAFKHHPNKFRADCMSSFKESRCSLSEGF